MLYLFWREHIRYLYFPPATGG